MHPVIGATMLEMLAKQYGDSLGFIPAAIGIVRHHHERLTDGQGYPDALFGDNIPPAARLVAVADVYDALRRSAATSRADARAGPAHDDGRIRRPVRSAGAASVRHGA